MTWVVGGFPRPSLNSVFSILKRMIGRSRVVEAVEKKVETTASLDLSTNERIIERENDIPSTK